MESIFSCETLVPAYKTGLCRNSQDRNMIIRRLEDPKSCTEIHAACLYRWHHVVTVEQNFRNIESERYSLYSAMI